MWQPVSNLDWDGFTNGPMGYVPYGTTLAGSKVQGTQYTWNVYAPFIYYDQRGAMHYLSVSTSTAATPSGGPCNAGQSTASGTAIDGSGYSVSITSFTTAVITTPGGLTLNAPTYSSGSVPVSMTCDGASQPSGRPASQTRTAI